MSRADSILAGFFTLCPKCKNEWPERLNCRLCAYLGSEPTPAGEELLRLLKTHLKKFVEDIADRRCRAPEDGS